MFYYLIDLHYSQTDEQARLKQESVLLPYRFTLFSNNEINSHRGNPVLLPYRFTLFSNLYVPNQLIFQFYYLIDLHYSQTK